MNDGGQGAKSVAETGPSASPTSSSSSSSSVNNVSENDQSNANTGANSAPDQVVDAQRADSTSIEKAAAKINAETAECTTQKEVLMAQHLESLASGEKLESPSSAMLWRNKFVSCESIRSFESMRKAQIEKAQDMDKQYWAQLEGLINASRDSNVRLQRFFHAKLQADTAYADSLRKLRTIIECPADVTTGNVSGVSTSCTTSLNSLAEMQQQLSEKLMQFTVTIKRDVLAKPLDEMVTTFEDKAKLIILEGTKLDSRLHKNHDRVIESFQKYDMVFREMELNRAVNKETTAVCTDLWLEEMKYSISCTALQRTRIEYVQGMASLFQQFKNLEILRTSVIQTVLETYLRKQKLIFAEMAGSMNETLSCSQRMDADRDTLITVRKLPANNTALALADGSRETDLFKQLRAPLSSPLVIRAGYVKRCVNSLFKSWKDALCVLTQDRMLHVFEIREGSSKNSIHATMFQVGNAAPREEGGNGLNNLEGIGLKFSVSLVNAKVSIEKLSFEIVELVPSTGMMGIFKSESSIRHAFQCKSKDDLINWVSAIRPYIP